MRPEIALSWKRSALSGLHPGSRPDSDPCPDLDTSSRLLTAARPILDEMEQQIRGTGFCILLADRDCRIAARLFDGPELVRSMDALGVVLGSRFGEDHVGTTALGTPLEVRRGVVIHGEEHYLEQFKDLSCYGHPIVHPVTRRVEGILDMTGIAARANPLFAPFLARAAADIERRLLEGSRVSQQRLVDAFQRMSPQHQVAVTAIGEDIHLSNRAALDLLQAADHATLKGLAVDLRPDRSVTARIRLVSGEPALVQAEHVAGTDGGAVFSVRPDSRTAPIRRRAAAARSVSERAGSELARLRDTRAPVAISGEPGTGRTTAVRDLAGDQSVVWLDAAAIALVGTQEWMDELLARASGTAAVLAIEDVQLVPESMLPVLIKLLATTSGPRIVMTSNSLEDLPSGVAGVLGRCPGRVVLPPLRQRRREFADLAQAILDSIEPGLRITASAFEALIARDWPGNLAELAVVLKSSASRCTSAQIAVDDLPDAYRTSPRVSRLAGRERAERQAIVEALRECGGNKVHAATALGISRSTLYVRMRALDITV
ncbi:MAG: helix-turn-helix domain-containing protein [Rhodococcus sp. (in: high G+C Gram-positive bacteria)]|uniref:sigma-54-dependent Fis family transcriptional regulator n=1 Tax=Rhodococcus sp. TaxID=1831 RepID=UPI003BAF5E87